MFNFIDNYIFIPVSGCLGMIPVHCLPRGPMLFRRPCTPNPPPTPLHSEIHTRHPQCSNHVKAAVQHASDPFLQRELLHPFQRVQVKRRILPDAEKELVVKLLQNMLKTS
jgi:hypothetical protein